jgi:hypothetical protein
MYIPVCKVFGTTRHQPAVRYEVSGYELANEMGDSVLAGFLKEGISNPCSGTRHPTPDEQALKHFNDMHLNIENTTSIPYLKNADASEKLKVYVISGDLLSHV